MAGPAGSYATDFDVAVDLMVLIGFSVVALLIAGARFSRDTANEPLVHRLASTQRD